MKLVILMLISILSGNVLADAKGNSLKGQISALESRVSELEALQPIPGPQGEQGIQGPAGEPGPQGLSGEDGRDLFPQVCYLYLTMGIDHMLEGCGPGLVVIQCKDGTIVSPEKGCPAAEDGTSTELKWDISENVKY